MLFSTLPFHFTVIGATLQIQSAGTGGAKEKKSAPSTAAVGSNSLSSSNPRLNLASSAHWHGVTTQLGTVSAWKHSILPQYGNRSQPANSAILRVLNT